jgi:hypothetical protein
MRIKTATSNFQNIEKFNNTQSNFGNTRSEYRNTQTIEQTMTLESMFSMTINAQDWVEQNDGNEVFGEIVKKIKITFREVNQYLTSCFNFMVGLIQRNDDRQDLIKYIKEIEEDDPIKSNPKFKRLTIRGEKGI